MPSAARNVHFCLPITDRKRAVDFYTTALGLEPVGPPAEDGIPEPLQLRLDTRTLLMLIPTGGFGWVIGDRSVAASGVSECLLSLTLDAEADIDRLAARVADAGGEVLIAPTWQDWGYAALCADPDGHVWQFTADPTA